ncbi:MAG: glycosyltransferase N-terminal domain-containing protein [Pseudoruegeria sp.]
MSFTLSLYQTARARFYGKARRNLRDADSIERQQRLGIATISRPPGPLVWLHAASEAEVTSAVEIFLKLQEEDDRVHVLITTPSKTLGITVLNTLPPGIMHQIVPEETPQSSRAFLQHWQPDICLWTGSMTHLTLLAQTKASGADITLIDTNETKAAMVQKRGWTVPVAQKVLAKIDRVLAANESAARTYEAMGAQRASIEVTGTLQEGSTVLPYDDLTYRILADAITPRPVWLAANASPEEEQQLLEIHRILLRTSHRLLLIFVPRDGSRLQELHDQATANGWNSHIHSFGTKPSEETQIVFGAPEDLGLWYRLAPTTFMGGTLMGSGGSHPFEPAALGSAIVYGKHTAPYQPAYARLVRAGAARLVLNSTGLEINLKDLQAADKSAEMAHAAWDVCSRGAEVADRVLEVILESLDAAEVRHARA